MMRQKLAVLTRRAVTLRHGREIVVPPPRREAVAEPPFT
jgi:hypothetical protein